MKKLFSSKQNTFYIADTFDHIPDALYFDFCHVSQKGNELIAEKIYHYTKEKL
jgi:hypothetical protein